MSLICKGLIQINIGFTLNKSKYSSFRMFPFLFQNMSLQGTNLIGFFLILTPLAQQEKFLTDSGLRLQVVFQVLFFLCLHETSTEKFGDAAMESDSIFNHK